MSVLVVGLSHRSAPVDLLERAVLGPDAAAKLLDDVARERPRQPRRSCSRRATGSRSTPTSTSSTAASPRCPSCSPGTSGVALDELTPHLYVHYEDRAVAHLFSVACGLDSMVVGESQILGQVAHGAADSRRTPARVGPPLGELVQQALRVGKRARTETGIDRAGRSLVTAGLDAAPAPSLGPVDGREVLVVGAGSMSALAATVVAQSGAAASPSPTARSSRGSRLADTVGGRAIELTERARGPRHRRPRRLLHRRRGTRPRRRPARGRRRGATGRTAPPGRCSTWPCPATSTPRLVSSTASPSSTSRRWPRRWRPASTSPTSTRPAPSSPTRSRRSSAGSAPCSVAPTVVALREHGRCRRASPSWSGSTVGSRTSTTARAHRDRSTTVTPRRREAAARADRAGQGARRPSRAGRPTPTRSASCSTSTPSRSRRSRAPMSNGGGGRD